MPQKETLNTRVTRLEEAMAHLAEVVATTRVEANEREKRMDKRIEKLVLAIGEWIRTTGGKQ